MRQSAASRQWKILKALEVKPMTSKDLLSIIDLSHHSIERYLRFLREDKRIYICGHIGTKGEPYRVYAIGNLPDVEYVPLKAPATKRTRRKDDMMRKVWAALSNSPLTARQMGELLHICHNRAGVYIAMLRREHPGRIYIKGYKPAPGQGQPAPIYAIGNGEDAKMSTKTPRQKYLEYVSDPDKREHRLRMERNRYNEKKRKKQPANWLSALGI